MKHRIITVAMLILTLLGNAAQAGPYAEKVNITSSSSPMGQLFIKDAKVPDASKVGIPAYPGAVIFQTREFGQMKGNGIPYLPYIKLLSSDPVEIVVNWYKQKLSSFFFEEKDFFGMISYRFWKVKGDYGMMDMNAMGTIENVIISDGKLHVDDYPSAVSMIEITYEHK